MHMESREEERQVDEDQASDDGHVPGVTEGGGSSGRTGPTAAAKTKAKRIPKPTRLPMSRGSASQAIVTAAPPSAYVRARSSPRPWRIERGLPQAPGRAQGAALAMPQHGRSQPSRQETAPACILTSRLRQDKDSEAPTGSVNRLYP